MIHCALCGFEYEPVPSCPASCPLNGACHFVCCPRCGYQNIDPSQSSSVKLVKKFWSNYVERKTPETKHDA